MGRLIGDSPANGGRRCGKARRDGTSRSSIMKIFRVDSFDTLFHAKRSREEVFQTNARRNAAVARSIRRFARLEPNLQRDRHSPPLCGCTDATREGTVDAREGDSTNRCIYRCISNV